MSDASEPQNEVLESNVAMKVELSHVRARIEWMMNMTQQLLQTKSTDRGQLNEESAGTGRGDANEDNGGAERAPRKEGAAGARVGVTTATVAGERVSNHSSRASGGSGPADETGQRPDAPAGVGPMINMQRGETGDSSLEGIGAHGGDDILSSSFQRQPRVVQPVMKGEKVSSKNSNMSSYLKQTCWTSLATSYVRGQEWYQ